MIAILYILATLATFRITYLIVYETGPWALAERLRSWVVNHYGPKSWQAEGIQCPLCVSFWIALIAAAAVLYGGFVGLAILLWLGIAGGCLVLHSWLIRR